MPRDRLAHGAVARDGIVAKSGSGCRMQWNEPRFSVLGHVDREYFCFEIDVLARQSQRFADTEPGDGEHAEECDVGQRAQSSDWRQTASSCEQRIDLGIGVDVMNRSDAGTPQGAARRHFGGQAERGEMAQEGSNDINPPRRELARTCAR